MSYNSSRFPDLGKVDVVQPRSHTPTCVPTAPTHFFYILLLFHSSSCFKKAERKKKKKYKEREVKGELKPSYFNK